MLKIAHTIFGKSQICGKHKIIQIQRQYAREITKHKALFFNWLSRIDKRKCMVQYFTKHKFKIQFQS